MGRRTLNAHKLVFNKLRDTDKLLSPADINGESLIDIIERWCIELKSAGDIEVFAESFITIKEVNRYSNNILIVEVMAGKTGEVGVVHDLEGYSEDILIGEKQAPMSSCRALLFSPNGGQMALWFSEYSERSSGARNLLKLLTKKWASFQTGAKLNSSRVVMSEAILENGKITEVEVRLVRRAADLTDGVESVKGVISHVFKPGRKTPLSAKLISVFRKNPEAAYDYVEIPEIVSEESEIFVSVDVDGHKRKINIGDAEDGVYFHEELNGPGKPKLSDSELVDYCTEEAVSYFDRSGYCWDEAWSKPAR